VVFLSPDADEPLGEVEPGTVYVIGGLVDAPIRPYASRRKAAALGWRTARLPLQESLPESSSRVLSINAGAF